MKQFRDSNDLAVFGGNPAFDKPLHVGRPNLGDRTRFMERVEGFLDRGMVHGDVHLDNRVTAKLVENYNHHLRRAWRRGTSRGNQQTDRGEAKPRCASA